MADTFTPRGAPVPSNSYDGWELTHRPAMLPFLAEYTNPQGETAGGWAMPNMVTEPVNALFRLLNTPTGTMPDPRDSQNQSDALTGLMALYGGNALGGVARNAMSRGVARGLDMEAARPVAYSNAIDEAMSNPNMLSMMRDIDYANLNRRALDEYGIGYEGLTSSQEAKLRGWSDPALLSDTGKPNPVGAGVAGHLPMDEASRMARAREMGFDTSQVLYHGTGKDFDAFNPGTRGNGAVRNIYLTDNPEIADIYANSQNYGLRGGGSPMVYPVFAKAEKPLVVSDKGPDGSFGWVSDNLAAALGVEHPPAGKYSSLYDEARRQGYDQVQIREMTDLGGNQTQYIPLEPKNIRSVNAAFDPAKADSSFLLASDTGKPNPLGAALASQDPDNTNALAELLKRYGVY